MSGKTPRTAESHPDADTEQRILLAARKVFVRRGTSGARMQEIAAEAGVNQALLHYYFRTKDRLAEAVFRDAASRLIPAVAGVLSSDASLEDKVKQVVHVYIDTVRQTPFLPGYVIAELHHHPERLTGMRDAAQGQPVQLVQTLLQKLGGQISERVAAGMMRPIAPEQFVANLMALVAIPFIARPVLDAAFGFDEAAFQRFLDERRQELPGFILNALRP